MTPEIVWPVLGNWPITFKFGEAPDWYVKAFGYPHNGVDIGCLVGTPVRACDAGEVVFSDAIPDQDGEGLILKHEWGSSLYWHLSQIGAKLGVRAEKGATIGLSGNTGFTTGPHLHFGMKVTGDSPEGMRGWSDPLKYLTGTIPEVSPVKPVERTHLVLPGQTLWGLAQKYYGSGFNWRIIYNANKDKIKNPNLIFPLQRLVIP